MAMVWIDDPALHFENKRVFCRVDFNVPVDDDGNILDDARIVATLPTLNYLLERKAKLVIASHLGRPKGKYRKNLSLEKVALRLHTLLGREITFVEDCIGDGVRKLINDMAPSQIVVLENLRFHSGEEKNDDNFARMLAQNADIYVDDAFGATHRAHASVALLPTLVQTCAGGFLLKKEIEALSSLLKSPKRPFVAVLGGSKVSDKISLIAKLLPRLDTLVIGGAMAYTFMKAKGFSVGQSRVEDDRLTLAKSLLDKAAASRVQVILPVDHLVMTHFASTSEVVVTADEQIAADQIGVDIGPKTRALMTGAITSAHTVFWNGPMGVFEWPSCLAGTKAVAEAIASNGGSKIAGGGDSISAIKQLHLENRFSHISTGGGASLAFLEGAVMPGLAALGYGV